MSALIIAEAGSTWQFGRLPLRNAKQAIAIAKECGANAVKFQWCSDGHAMAKRRRLKGNPYTMLNWPKTWIPQLAAQCESVGIEFMCTVFIEQDVEIVAPFVKRFKIASLEAGDEALGRACVIAMPRRDVLISQGCASVSTVPESMLIRRILGQVKILQCTSAYPAPLASMNIKTVSYRHLFDGLSDHSGHVLTGAVAVAAGASIIEVHFRLDRTPKDNPDYGHSHAPKQLEHYISNVRTAEVMLGDGRKKIEPCEMMMKKHLVRS